MKFGKQESRNFRAFAEFVHHNMVFPRKIDVAGTARVAPNCATFRVKHRFVALFIAANVIVG